MYTHLNCHFLRSNLTDLQAIAKSISNIITTSIGTVPGYPEFGCNVEEYLFEQLDNFTKDNIMSAIEYAINKFEPRVNILDIDTKDIPQNHSLFVYVTYEVISDGIEDTVQIQLR